MSRSGFGRLAWTTAGNSCFAAPALIGLGSIAGVIIGTYILLQYERASSVRLEYMVKVGEKLSALNSDMATTASAVRAYVISKSSEDRANFDRVAALIDADLAALESTIAEDPAEANPIDYIRPVVAARIALMRETLAVADSDDTDGARLAAIRRRGEELTSRFLAVTETIRSQTRDRFLRQRDASAPRIRTTTAVVAVCVVAAVASACLMLGVMVRRGRERARMEILRRLNADLEERVRERTAELARSEARQRGYFENAPMGFHVMRRRADGHFAHEDVNPAGLQIYGFTRADVIGRPLRDIWPAADAEAMEARLRHCVESGERVQYFASRVVDGAPRHLDVLLAPIHDPGCQDPAGQDLPRGRDTVLACVRDVTTNWKLEQRIIDDAERQAQAAEREMAFFRGSADGLFVVGVTLSEPDPECVPHFVFEAFSPAFERITGLLSDDLVGRDPASCLPPEMAGIALERFRRCVQSGATISYDDRIELPSGTRDIEGLLTPIRHSLTGAIVRLAGQIRDVSERNQLEAELRQTQRMEAIGKMSAGVAHDFNNLLQAIISSLELVKDDVLSGTQAEAYATIALKAAQRGASLTRHLLAYARKQLLVPQAIDLVPFLADMKQLLAYAIGTHIAIEVRLDSEVPPIFADPGQLQTALLNLAVNASHAMKQGGKLALDVRETDDLDARRVAISVTDTGTGMDAETLAHATDPFFTTKGLEGSGLGLSMVKGFVEQSGGELHLSSTLGVGTRIELRMPAAPAPAGAADAPTSASLAPVAAACCRVLLVDDTTDVLVTTGAFLAKAGFDVTRAKTGNEALGFLAAGQRFDVLLTDYAMPGMNGADLVAESRLMQPGLPALIITGYSGAERDPALPRDVAVFRKPITRLHLIQTVLRVASPSVQVR